MMCSLTDELIIIRYYNKNMTKYGFTKTYTLFPKYLVQKPSFKAEA